MSGLSLDLFDYTSARRYQHLSSFPAFCLIYLITSPRLGVDLSTPDTNEHL
jgi:hypothetical protein